MGCFTGCCGCLHENSLAYPWGGCSAAVPAAVSPESSHFLHLEKATHLFINSSASLPSLETKSFIGQSPGLYLPGNKSH